MSDPDAPTPPAGAHRPPLSARTAAWLHAFLPAPMQVDRRERLRACVGAAAGVLLAALVSRGLAAPAAGAWLVASLGASAVLVFAVPASPLAQPWSVVGGNTLSALMGVACAAFVADPAVAAALAVGLAIGLMFSLRCLHPPGSATALAAVLAHQTSWHFAAYPVLVNSLLLVAVGVAYNSLTGRRYPHRPAAAPAAAAAVSRFSAADLDAALAHYNQVLDVSRDDLEALLHEAEAAAYQRNLGSLRCRDIMVTEVVSVAYGTPLDEAWALLRGRNVKALPVIDRAGRIGGIVTLADFLRHAGLDRRSGLGERLRGFVRRTDTVHTDKPEAVGQIMTRQVRVASADRPLIELVPLFSEAGHHHIPVIDEGQRLVGMLTQTDLVRALARAVRTGA